MNTKQINLFIVQVEVILEQAKRLQGKDAIKLRARSEVIYKYYIEQIDELILQYNRLVPKINKLFKIEEIDEELDTIDGLDPDLNKIREGRVLYNVEKQLLKLIFGSSTILPFLREGLVLPEPTQDRLDSLTIELENLKDSLIENVYTNLIESKNTFEKGCFLGSSLISGKVIRACLDKVEGNDISERIETLKALGLIREKDGKDFILKTNHFSRNITSHDLSIIPSSSEAISYLGDVIKISKIISEYEVIRNGDSSPDNHDG